jgi:hypothetical protein
MSISEMKKQIPTIESEAIAIIKSTEGEPQKLAKRLFEDIKNLNESVALLEHGARQDATAERIGEDIQKIANIVTVLTSKTSFDIHQRLNVIFKELNIMKAEGTSKDNPLVALWLAKGMKKATNVT